MAEWPMQSIRIRISNFLVRQLPKFRGRERLWRLVVPREGWFETTLGIKLRLAPGDYTSRRLILGDGGNQLPFDFARTTPAGGCFLDIGSNRGPYACVAGRAVGSDGVVVAVEPNRDLWSPLVDNLREHVSGRCLLVPAAISDVAGWQSFSVESPRHTGGGHLVPTATGGSPAKSVPVQTAIAAIEPFLRGHEREIRVKIDVEGAELRVLYGLESILRRKECRGVLVEISSVALARFGSSEAEILEFMDSMGFCPRISRDQAAECTRRDGYYDQWFERSD